MKRILFSVVCSALCTVFSTNVLGQCTLPTSQGQVVSCIYKANTQNATNLCQCPSTTAPGFPFGGLMDTLLNNGYVGQSYSDCVPFWIARASVSSTLGNCLLGLGVSSTLTQLNSIAYTNLPPAINISTVMQLNTGSAYNYNANIASGQTVYGYGSVTGTPTMGGQYRSVVHVGVTGTAGLSINADVYYFVWGKIFPNSKFSASTTGGTSLLASSAFGAFNTNTGTTTATATVSVCQSDFPLALTAADAAPTGTYYISGGSFASPTSLASISGGSATTIPMSAVTSGTTYTLKRIATQTGTNAVSAVTDTSIATITITINPNNTVGTPSSSPSVCTNSALTPITIATTGATGIGTATGLPAGVTASWASNTITISGTPTATGAFNYTIPLTGGCGTISATGSITVNAIPTVGVTATPTGAICAGSTLTLSGTGATSYNWSGSVQDGTAFTATNGTTYNVTGTDVNGCTASSSYTATVNPTNTAATPASASVCINTALTPITIATTGATGIGTATGLPAGVTASWTSNNITISGTLTATGAFNYTIPLTGGCGTISATGTITVNAIPTVGVSATPTGAICSNATLTLSGTGATSYAWSGGVFDGTAFSPTNGTVYTVTGTTAGCSATASYTATVTQATTYYQDADGDGYGNPSATQQSCTGAPTGYVTDNTDCDDNDAAVHTGCAVNSTFTATNASGANVPISGGLASVCSGDLPITLTPVTTGGTFTITAPAPYGTVALGSIPGGCGANCVPNSPLIPAGTYPLSYTVGGSTTTINVTLSTSPTVAVTASPSGAICTGTSIDLTATGGTTYDWSNGGGSNATATFASPTDGTVYTVTGTTSGCSATASYTATVTASVTYYQDADGDGYGNPNVSVTGCTEPAGYVTNDTDCDDTNPDIHPGATDIPDDGVDQDCNGSDASAGGSADFTGQTASGTTINGVNGGAVSICLYDLPVTLTNTGSYTITIQGNPVPLSAVGDGYTVPVSTPLGSVAPGTYLVTHTVGTATTTVNVTVNPTPAVALMASPSGPVCTATTVTLTASGADTYSWTPSGTGAAQTVTPTDGAVYSVTGTALGCSASASYTATVTSSVTYYQDADGDGYGNPNVSVTGCTQPAGYVTNDTDCDDTNPNIHPGATDIPGDGVDQDCNGSDASAGGNADFDATLSGGTVIHGTNGGSVTICLTDLPVTLTNTGSYTITIAGGSYPLSAVGDGYTVPVSTPLGSVAPGTYPITHTVGTATSTVQVTVIDCDTAINPTDSCNGLPAETYYRDADGDGYGDPFSFIHSCASTPPAGYVSNNQDCDDNNAAVHPGAIDNTVDGTDQDCNNIDGNGASGINNIAKELGISIYPNPASDKVTLVGNVSTTLSITIYSIQGSLVMQDEISFSNKHQLDVSAFAQGAYVLGLKDINTGHTGYIQLIIAK